jgi:hypothetical protein
MGYDTTNQREDHRKWPCGTRLHRWEARELSSCKLCEWKTLSEKQETEMHDPERNGPARWDNRAVILRKRD